MGCVNICIKSLKSDLIKADARCIMPTFPTPKWPAKTADHYVIWYPGSPEHDMV